MIAKWRRIERQRPPLKTARWGFTAGLALIAAGVVGAHTVTLGVLTAAASGVWASRILRRP